VKRPLLFLAKLLLFSLLLMPVFYWFDKGYFFLIKAAHLRPLKQIAYVSSEALYPFFVLVLATPKLGIKKRVISIVAATVLAFMIDLTMIYVWGTFPFKQEPIPTLGHIWAGNSWQMVMHWLLPILFWMVIAYRQIEELFNGDGALES
jgi:hypothetical protein